MMRIFSDEKTLEKVQKSNKENWQVAVKRSQRCYHSDAHQLPILGSTAGSGIQWKRRHSSFFFQLGLRENVSDYNKVLEDTVKPWTDRATSRRPYVFQQDGHSAHKAQVTQNGLANNVSCHWFPDVWPLSSPDLNRLDYYGRGVVERETNKRLHHTMYTVKNALYDLMTNMFRVLLIKTCERFPRGFRL